MGRKGDLLRAMKKQKAEYTFTGEQLEQHDRQVVQDYFKNAMPMVRKMADEEDAKRFDEMSRRIDNLWMDNSATLLSYAMALSCRVLIEHFGWKPIRGNRRTKTTRYAEALVAEYDRVTAGKEGMKQYAKETKKLYNLSFVAEGDEEEWS